MKKFSLFPLLLIFSLLLSACITITLPPQPTAQVTPEATLPVQPTSTVEQPVPASPTPQVIVIEVTATPTQDPFYTDDYQQVDMEGISFKLPGEVADGAVIVWMPADNPDDPWPEMQLPERRTILFDGYVIPEHFHVPMVYIYPLEDIYATGQHASIVANRLTDVLNNPALNLHAEPNLPFLPIFNAGQVLHVVEDKLESENSRGIRYLTMYSQGFTGVTDDEIFYTYQGISSDGEYYIAAILPIHSALLPDLPYSNEEMAAIADNFEAYLFQTKDVLQVNYGGFLLPSLEALDSMLLSIKVSQ